MAATNPRPPQQHAKDLFRGAGIALGRGRQRIGQGQEAASQARAIGAAQAVQGMCCQLPKVGAKRLDSVEHSKQAAAARVFCFVFSSQPLLLPSLSLLLRFFLAPPRNSLFPSCPPEPEGNCEAYFDSKKKEKTEREKQEKR